MTIEQNFISFFYDPILRAPTIGCMLMCFAASLMGVVVFLRKESLIGEALSHTAYPGVLIGALVAGSFFLEGEHDALLTVLTLIFAFLSSIFGLWLIRILQKRLKVPGDSALCFVLSTFFGVGLTIASELQFSHAGLYKQVLTYLYGQAATMTDVHILIYGLLALAVLLTIIVLYKELQVITFDYQYAKSLGIRVRSINLLILVLVAISVIIGIRSVGVVLMSAMLIAPVVAARQFTNRLSTLFVLAAFFGVASGFFGNYFSVIFTEHFAHAYPSRRIILPTGPMIVLVASAFAFMALLFSPERGLLIRFLRIISFRYTCICENILKAVWRADPNLPISFHEISKYQDISSVYLKFLLFRMRRSGWLEKQGKKFILSVEGRHRAAKIVRLHRLWEAYLANYLGFGLERVHRNAEEMEHILTPELERKLTILLNDPKEDPHFQPIPPKGGLSDY